MLFRSYFDQPTKARVLDGISALMPDDGMLFLGGAETVLGISEKLKPVTGQRGVYCLANGGGPAGQSQTAASPAFGANPT